MSKIPKGTFCKTDDLECPNYAYKRSGYQYSRNKKGKVEMFCIIFEKKLHGGKKCKECKKGEERRRSGIKGFSHIS